MVFPLDRDILTDRILSAIRSEEYEAEESQLLKRVLEPHDRILELGSGLGYISAICAKSALVDHVATVEGNPLLKPYIEEFHRVNGVADRITRLSGIAVPRPTVPELTFYQRANFWASSLDGEKWKFVKAIQVSTMDLNALIAQHRPTMLVIDIEGGEAEVFDGIELDGVSKIMMELHQEVIGRAGVKNMFDRLGERGFHYDQTYSCGCQLFFSHIDRPSS
jgi:FkbM family methyltransferase